MKCDIERLDPHDPLSFPKADLCRGYTSNTSRIYSSINIEISINGYSRIPKRFRVTDLHIVRSRNIKRRIYASGDHVSSPC